MHKPKLVRITTVPQFLQDFVRGQHRYMTEQGLKVIRVSSAGKALDKVRNNEKIRVVSINMARTISQIKDLK